MHEYQMPDISLFKPSDYYRSKHPDLFSDTIIKMEPLLSKGFLEYHLETLTSRKQEMIFEDFCRRIAEVEICPNLQLQTGPVGGGDSKTDASTYPVSPFLSERCYWGRPDPPTNENWAFAFSCKKQWKGKVRDDVKKIANLDKKFRRVYFISNQFIRDKDRANEESRLKLEYGIDIHILDRTWIIAKVFKHRHEEMAIDSLCIEVSEKEKPQLGPNDTSRQLEYDRLLKMLSQPGIYLGNDYALAQDYLKIAAIARGLEKPRYEIDGFFVKAKKLAIKYGYRGQIIRCCYQHAWTSLWWFDDLNALDDIYGEMENYLPGTEDAEECELFFNLLIPLFPWAIETKAIDFIAKLEERRDTLRSQVERLSKKTDRPTNALSALTILYELDIYSEIYNVAKKMKTENVKREETHKDIFSFINPLKIESAFKGLKKCLEMAKGLGMYPLFKFCHTFETLGEIFGNLQGYNELYDAMLDAIKERSGEIERGKFLYKRGIQALHNENLDDILRYMGRARSSLMQENTLEGGIHAALVCSHAYRSKGLLWAARREGLLAANFAMQNYESIYRYPKLALFSAIQMSDLELKLGRIAPFIAWYELSWHLVNHLRSMQIDIGNLEEDLKMQELILGCFFLNLKSDDLKTLASLANGLDNANLPMARFALLYGLGDIDTLINEGPEEWSADKEKLDKFFRSWKTQLASEETPNILAGQTQAYCEFKTTIMGVSYRLKSKNSFGSIAFAEDLLSSIEAALALARWENLAFIIDEVYILVDSGLDGRNPPMLNLEEPYDPKGYEFIWKPDLLDWISGSHGKQVSDYVQKFFFKLLLDITIDPIEDLKQEFEFLAKDGAFYLAFSVLPTINALKNVIGVSSYDIECWANPAPSSEI
jgi:hypothetical protein